MLSKTRVARNSDRTPYSKEDMKRKNENNDENSQDQGNPKLLKLGKSVAT